MLNGRVVLFGIPCILFVAAAFGQDPSDPNIITVTKQIDVAKLDENVEELNRNVKTLTDTLGKLNENVEKLNKTVGDLEKTVVRIDERTKGILGWQYAIFGVMGAIFASMVVFFFTQWIPNRGIAKRELGRADDAKRNFRTALDLAEKAGDEELKSKIMKIMKRLED